MNLIKLLVAVALMLVSTIVTADKATDAKVNALDARMQRIERVVDNQALLNLAKRIEALQREVQELRGENEQLVHEINTLKTRQREQYLDIDRRLQSSSGVPEAASIPASREMAVTDTTVTQSQEVTQSPPTSVPPSTTSTSSQVEITTPRTTQIETTTPGTTSGTTVATIASSDAAEDYKNAFTLLKQGKYDDSIVAFGSFLQTHPDSKYAANAQYWLAEANYVSKRYPQALSEFSKVVNKYPASSKVADARLKLGFTHYELGQYEEARVELTRLRAKFPNSTVASLAQQRLERMSREGH